MMKGNLYYLGTKQEAYFPGISEGIHVQKTNYIHNSNDLHSLFGFLYFISFDDLTECVCEYLSINMSISL